MKKLLLSVIGLGLLLCAGAVFAVRVSTLYQTTIPVASQSVEERNQVLPQALGQVLIKVSGNNQVLANPKLKAALAAPGALVQEFSYTKTTGSKPYLLQLDFDPDGVDKILRDTGIATWGQNRPLILVWLEREIPDRPAEIIDNDTNDDTLTFLKQNADRRGLPVIFPTMDVTDLSVVSVKDVAAMSIPTLTTAAKRYASDAILVGRLIRTPTGFNTQWKLVMGSDQWDWTIPGNSMADVMATIADDVAETLAGRYATVVTNNVQANLKIKITGVTQSDDVAQIIQYIKHLTQVADVQLVQVTGNDLILNISLRSSIEAFAQAISVGQRLTLVPAGGNPPMLIYQWNH